MPKLPKRIKIKPTQKKELQRLVRQRKKARVRERRAVAAVALTTRAVGRAAVPAKRPYVRPELKEFVLRASPAHSAPVTKKHIIRGKRRQLGKRSPLEW